MTAKNCPVFNVYGYNSLLKVLLCVTSTIRLELFKMQSVYWHFVLLILRFSGLRKSVKAHCTEQAITKQLTILVT